MRRTAVSVQYIHQPGVSVRWVCESISLDRNSQVLILRNVTSPHQSDLVGIPLAGVVCWQENPA